jgi:hypothetical protein
VNDIGQAIHFMHPTLLSTGMLKLPLPCSPKLWEAKSANEWKDEMSRSQPQHSMDNLQMSLRVLLGNNDESQSRTLLGGFEPNPFGMQILVQGLLSAVLEFDYSMPSTSSKAIYLLRLEDIKIALT